MDHSNIEKCECLTVVMCLVELELGERLARSQTVRIGLVEVLLVRSNARGNIELGMAVFADVLFAAYHVADLSEQIDPIRLLKERCEVVRSQQRVGRVRLGLDAAAILNFPMSGAQDSAREGEQKKPDYQQFSCPKIHVGSAVKHTFCQIRVSSEQKQVK